MRIPYLSMDREDEVIEIFPLWVSDGFGNPFYIMNRF